jgi:hypothetical protein
MEILVRILPGLGEKTTYPHHPSDGLQENKNSASRGCPLAPTILGVKHVTIYTGLSKTYHRRARIHRGES